MKMYVFELGSLKLDKNLVVSMSHVARVNDPRCENEMVEFPVPAYLFETEEGYVLYDTGCHPDCMGENGRWPVEFQNQVPYEGDETTTILYQLEQLGIKPDEIRTVILSHMHNDHAGCVEYFPNAEFIVHKDEFNACIGAYAQHRYMDSYIWKDTDVWIKKKLNWKFLECGEGDYQVCPGLTILNLGPGHARGVLALKVDLEKTGTVIITSDAVYCSENYEQEREPGVIYDTVGWRRSLKYIKKVAKDSNAQVWFGHDRKQFDTLVKAQGGYYE